jgi:hypothetical protein
MILTPEQRLIWARMPADAQRRATEASKYIGTLAGWIDLWDSAQRNQRKWDHLEDRANGGDERARRWLMQRSGDVTDEQQDELDEKLVARVGAGEYGAEAKRALEEVLRSIAGQTTQPSRRAVLRESRRAIVMAREAVL